MAQYDYAKLREFARKLGWRNCKVHRQSVPAMNGHPKSVVSWMECGDLDDLWFQIQFTPRYRVAVFALKYGICSGYHQFRLARRTLDLEVQRLAEWVDRSWFDSRAGRQKYRKMHPECAGLTWRKIRENGFPYPRNVRATPAVTPR